MQSELLGHCPSEDWGQSCLLAVASLAEACHTSFSKGSAHKAAHRIISTLVQSMWPGWEDTSSFRCHQFLPQWLGGVREHPQPLCRQTLAERETARTVTKAASTNTAGKGHLSMGLGAMRVGKQWFQEAPNSLSCFTLKIHLMWISVGKLFKLTLLCQLKRSQVSKITFCAHLGDQNS